MAEKLRRKVGVSNGQAARTQEPVAQSSSRAVVQTERLTDGETDRLTEVGKRKGINVKRYFTHAGVHPFAEVEWEKRSAVISGEKGEVVFEQHDVEIPKSWSQLATNVVVSKYFRGPLGTPEREHSVRQLIGRVVETLTGWGRKDGYFTSEEDALLADYPWVEEEIDRIIERVLNGVTVLDQAVVEAKAAYRRYVWSFVRAKKPEPADGSGIPHTGDVKRDIEIMLDAGHEPGYIWRALQADKSYTYRIARERRAR